MSNTRNPLKATPKIKPAATSFNHPVVPIQASHPELPNLVQTTPPQAQRDLSQNTANTQVPTSRTERNAIRQDRIQAEAHDSHLLERNALYPVDARQTKFIEMFIATVLAAYIKCHHICNTSCYNTVLKGVAATGVISYLSNMLSKPLGQDGQQAITASVSMLGALTTAMAAQRQAKQQNKAQRVINLTSQSGDIREIQEFVKLVEELAGQLYFRYKAGINKLENSPDGVTTLAKFFAKALIANLKNGKLNILLDEPYHEKRLKLLKLAIPRKR